MKSLASRILAGALVTTAGLWVACGQHTPDASVAGQLETVDLSKLPGSIFKVTWGDDTIVLDLATTRKVLRGISLDSKASLLDSSSAQLQKLAPGKILFLQEMALRRVVKVAPAGPSEVAVLTQRANLADAISDGEVKFSYPVRFGAQHARKPAQQSFFRPIFFAPSVLHAESEGSSVLTGNFMDWNYAVEATPSLDRIDMKADFKQQKDNLVLDVNAAGYLANFETAYDLLVRDRGALKKLDWTNKNINGQLTVAFNAAYDGTGPLTGARQLGFMIPAALLPGPANMVLAGLPVSVRFGGAMQFRPGFTGRGELAKGKFEVHYSGVMGMSFSAGHSTPNGELHGDERIIEAPALSAIGPEGMINGLVLPRIELSFESTTIMRAMAKALPSTQNAQITKMEKALLGNAFDAIQGQVNQAEAAASGNPNDTGSVSDQAGHFTVDLKSAADLYAEVVVVASLVAGGGMTSLGLPCEKVMLQMTGKVGIQSPPVFGGVSLLPKSLAPLETEIFSHGVTQAHSCHQE